MNSGFCCRMIRCKVFTSLVTEAFWPSTSTMRCALQTAESFALGAFVGGGEVKESASSSAAGRKPADKIACRGANGLTHGAKADSQIRAVGRQRQQLERGFGDDAEQAFRANEQPVQIEAGFVFVRAPPSFTMAPSARTTSRPST